MPLLTSEGTRRSLSAIHRAELIALPLLFIALLLVFQSFAAAAIPAAFGAAMIASSTGALALVARAIHLDAFALAISCMVGLALAVDYSLLMVSRTREELAERHAATSRRRSAAPPCRRSARSPSRAAAIVVAMAVAAAVSPGTGLVATAVGVGVVALLAARDRDPRRPRAARRRRPVPRPRRAAERRRRRQREPRPPRRRAARARPRAPRSSCSLACIPVLGLKTGAPTAKSLPSGDAARAQYDTVAKSMGAGWTEPFEIVAVTRKGTVTTASRLAALARVQRTLAKDPAVRAVLGPGAIAESAAKLRSSGRKALAASQGVPQPRTAGACASSTPASARPPTASAR